MFSSMTSVGSYMIIFSEANRVDPDQAALKEGHASSEWNRFTLVTK